MAKNCVIDLLGCGIAANATAEAAIILEFVRETPSPPEATIWGTWEKSSALTCALGNAFISHILEMDDFHTTGFEHPGVSVIPAVIGMAEKYRKTGKQVIEAIVAGYEVEIRVGEVLGATHYYFWHTTCTGGSFGAAAATGKLLQLTAEQIADALGNAGSQSAGLWQFLEENAMTKYLHCAKANYNGMFAALLAKRGLTGARRILEGDRGLLKATSKTESPEQYFESLGGEYKIMTAGFKPWPSCRHTHPTIEACLNLRRKHEIDPRSIDEVVVETYLAATQVAKNNVTFDDLRAAKFSISYCAALALMFGKVDINDFTSLLHDPAVRTLVSRIHVVAAKDLEAYRPTNTPARVTVQSSGETVSDTVYLPKGEPPNPFTDQEIDDKFLAMVTDVIGEARAKELLQSCRRLEELSDFSLLFTDKICGRRDA
jgi:2-methylcitrate dehydratase PrpD